MHFGRTQQVIALMIVWAAALIGVDKTLNHTPATMAVMPGAGKPQIIVTFTHFCCTGCYDKMFSAAKSMSWIVTASTDRGDLKKQEEMQQKEQFGEAAKIETMFQKDATLLLDDRDLKSVDMVRVQREFKDAGLVPRRLILENIPHFRLVAIDPHLCCGICEGAANSSMMLEQSDLQKQAKIDDPSLDPSVIKSQVMPSFVVDRSKQQISAEFYQKADVTGFLNAMERAGFSPKEIRIEVIGGAS
jgi:hypothetical protein